MILYSRWLELPLQTRIQITNKFGVVKKGNTEVFNNQVIRDGYDIKDIEEMLSKMTPDSFEDTVSEIEGRKREPKISVLPKQEADQFNKEYEERNPGKKAPVVEIGESLRGADALVRAVEENKNLPTLDEAIKENKKRGRPTKIKTNETKETK